MVFLPVILPAPLSRHPSLLLLRLHLPVQLQRLLQPLNLLLQHYLCVALSSSTPALSIPDDDNFTGCRASCAVLGPPRPPWLARRDPAPATNHKPSRPATTTQARIARPTQTIAPLCTTHFSPCITFSPQVRCTSSTQTPAISPHTSPSAYNDETRYYQLPAQSSSKPLEKKTGKRSLLDTRRCSWLPSLPSHLQPSYTDCH